MAMKTLAMRRTAATPALRDCLASETIANWAAMARASPKFAMACRSASGKFPVGIGRDGFP